MKERTFRISLNDKGAVALNACQFAIADGMLRIYDLADRVVMVFAPGVWQYIAIEEIGTQDKGFPNV